MRYTDELFKEVCGNIHNGVYDYSIVEYNGLKNKINIICKKHGVVSQRAQSHILGARCKECYNESRNITGVEFSKISNEIHKNRYEYIDFISLKKKVKIVCKKHGIFLQMPYKHLKGQGCKDCSRELHRISQSDFIERSKNIHSDIYDYTLVDYINHSTKVSIICKKHGIFNQTPNNHMTHKKECPDCSRIVSKMETNWLNSLSIQSLHRQYKLKVGDRKFIVDGFDDKKNIIYEFYGDYWHGNINVFDGEEINKTVKKKFIDLYKSTLDREEYFKKFGYNVVSIWENDYKKSIKI